MPFVKSIFAVFLVFFGKNKNLKGKLAVFFNDYVYICGVFTHVVPLCRVDLHVTKRWRATDCGQ